MALIQAQVSDTDKKKFEDFARRLKISQASIIKACVKKFNKDTENTLKFIEYDLN